MSKSTILNRRSFLEIAGPASLALTSAGAMPSWSKQSSKPNILILYSDDQGYGDLSCFSATDVSTPYLDSLAESGVRLDHWYSNAPVCSPSRASLLTGRYPNRTGLKGNAHRGLNDLGINSSEITIAELLKPLGYKTGAFGKWHVGSMEDCRPNAQGFDEFYGFLSGCIDYYSHIMYWGQGKDNYPYHDLWKNNEEVWENGQYVMDRITDEATHFIRDNQQGPFLAYVAFNSPHYPMHAPQEYFERFAHIEDPQRRTQAAMVSKLDDCVGRILNELDRLGIRENTLIYFQSDNGPSVEQRNLLDDSNQKYHGGSSGPFRGHKGSLFEGGVRVPAIMSWPGVVPEGRVCKEICITMDIFPTIAKLTGAELPQDRKIDGIDIFPVVTQNARSPHTALHWKMGDQRSVIDGDWKMVLNGRADFEPSGADPEFLCNLTEDPCETTNLWEKNPEIVKKLKQKIEAMDQEFASGS